MKKVLVVIMTLVSLGLAASDCFAHGGGLDGWGGHTVRTAGPGRLVGTYHFHR